MATNGKSEFGPIELIVCTFKGDQLPDRARAYLESHPNGSSEHPVRLISAMVIEKHKDGTVERKDWTGLDEQQEKRLCAAAGALFGMGKGMVEGFDKAGLPGARVGMRFGAVAGAIHAARHDYGMSEQELAEAIEDIPADTSAFIALVEHPWILKARDAFEQSGGKFFAHGWITPEALVRLGAREAIRDAVAERVGVY